MVSLTLELVLFEAVLPCGDESMQDASVWNLKRKLLTLDGDTAFHQAGQE